MLRVHGMPKTASRPQLQHWFYLVKFERSLYDIPVDYVLLDDLRIPYSYTANITDGAETTFTTPSSFTSLLSIILRTRLGRQFQCLGRVLLWHEHLHKLEFICFSKFLVIEEVFSLLLRLDLVSFGVLRGAAKARDEVCVLPWLDVVVWGFEAMDVAFDGVAFVVDEKAGIS